jgi:hypothetical protein
LALRISNIEFVEEKEPAREIPARGIARRLLIGKNPFGSEISRFDESRSVRCRGVRVGADCQASAAVREIESAVPQWASDTECLRPR